MKAFLAMGLLALLTACSTAQSVKGIGTGTDSYKESPCACLIIEQPNFARG